MTEQKHTVTTDALKTLGTIINEEAGRDAIHLAVEPVFAASTLFPGDHVGKMSDGRWGQVDRNQCVGIVDPFLQGKVQEDQRFWLVIYPRTITSLRHVWDHPSFPKLVPEEIATPEIKSNLELGAEKWLLEYAKEIDEDLIDLLEAANSYIQRNEYFYGAEDEDGTRGKFEGTYLPEEFWVYYQNYTGVVVPEHKKDSFFSCSC